MVIYYKCGSMQSKIFKSIYPYTQELLAEYPLMDDAGWTGHSLVLQMHYRTWKNYSFP